MTDFIKILDDSTRILAQIVNIAGIGGIFYAILSFKKSQKDTRNSEKTKYMENSIEVLGTFCSKLIPLMGVCRDDYHNKYNEYIQKYKDEVFLKEGQKIEKLPEKLEAITKLRAKSGMITVFNQLEQICAYISYDLILEDVVYPTVHSVFLDFCEENKDVLDYITSDDTPFNHVHDVIGRWSKNVSQENKEKRKRELKRELEILEKK